MSPIESGFLASLGAGAMTAAGALPVLMGRSVSRRMNDALLGFAAGVMLSASFFSLISPGIETATRIYGSAQIAALIAVVAIVLGVGFVAALNEWVPHEHFIQGKQGPLDSNLTRIWLLVLAITIHNIPEGLAVGVGFGNGDVARGISLAIGIGLQNAPEGLAVAVALLASGYSRGYAFLVASATGAVEPMAGVLGAWAASLSELALPWALNFAAGAMLYVISHEIIPETHRHGYETEATAGLTVGLVVMLYLDTAMTAG
jgi:ZIP family zinc transporter